MPLSGVVTDTGEVVRAAAPAGQQRKPLLSAFAAYRPLVVLGVSAIVAIAERSRFCAMRQHCGPFTSSLPQAESVASSLYKPLQELHSRRSSYSQWMLGESTKLVPRPQVSPLSPTSDVPRMRRAGQHDIGNGRQGLQVRAQPGSVFALRARHGWLVCGLLGHQE